MPTTATVRMYRLNELGDCFLLTFTADTKRCHVLVDCGSFRNSTDAKSRLKEIVARIRTDLNGDALDVVVGTHQHNDHLSGFVHCEDEFRDLKVGEVWLSWLEDPHDRKAREIGREFNNLRLGVYQVMQQLAAHPATKRIRSRAANSLERTRDMMGFFGAAAATPPELPARAIKVLKSLGMRQPKYLKPSHVLPLPELGEDHVRVHVLGPPRNETSLRRKGPRDGESYDHALAGSVRMVSVVARALDKSDSEGKARERNYPFGDHVKCQEKGHASKHLKRLQTQYESLENAWRNIDDDWLETAGGLALYLDDYTNNSSLVLAFEMVESGKVLLFAADAQTGNWTSWSDIDWPDGHPGTDALLERTVFYKVGHHASHNATLKARFENMGSDGLCALIPVHKKDPNITKKGGWRMPAKALFRRLVERTEGRVLQMDDVNPAECDLGEEKVQTAWKQAGVHPVVTDDSITLTFK